MASHQQALSTESSLETGTISLFKRFDASSAELSQSGTTNRVLSAYATPSHVMTFPRSY